MKNKNRIVRVAVRSRQEARALLLGLNTPEVWAFVLTMGMKRMRPGDHSRPTVQRYVRDKLNLSDV